MTQPLGPAGGASVPAGNGERAGRTTHAPLIHTFIFFLLITRLSLSRGVRSLAHGSAFEMVLGQKAVDTSCRQGLPLIELCHKGIMSLVEFGA